MSNRKSIPKLPEPEKVKSAFEEDSPIERKKWIDGYASTSTYLVVAKAGRKKLAIRPFGHKEDAIYAVHAYPGVEELGLAELLPVTVSRRGSNGYESSRPRTQREIEKAIAKLVELGELQVMPVRMMNQTLATKLEESCGPADDGDDNWNWNSPADDEDD